MREAGVIGNTVGLVWEIVSQSQVTCDQRSFQILSLPSEREHPHCEQPHFASCIGWGPRACMVTLWTCSQLLAGLRMRRWCWICVSTSTLLFSDWRDTWVEAEVTWEHVDVVMVFELLPCE